MVTCTWELGEEKGKGTSMLPGERVRDFLRFKV